MGTFVYLVKDDGSVTLRKVTTGAVDGDWVAIEGELEPGDRWSPTVPTACVKAPRSR
jgi:multidrug efflux system membrane fusion protein